VTSYDPLPAEQICYHFAVDPSSSVVNHQLSHHKSLEGIYTEDHLAAPRVSEVTVLHLKPETEEWPSTVIRSRIPHKFNNGHERLMSPAN